MAVHSCCISNTTIYEQKKKKGLSGTSKVPMTFKWGMRVLGET